MPFIYSQAALAALDDSISIPRLTRYLAEAHGDRHLAIQLYEYNTRVSSAMFEIIQPLEIAFRNSIHRVLTSDLGQANWYDGGILAKPEMDSIYAVRQNFKLWKKIETPDRMVAELTFGYRVRLLNAKYEKTLWVSHLWKCFPNGPWPDREKMLARFIKIRDLRNRIAHHEPIFFRNLETESMRALSTLEWICPTSASWVRATHSISRLT